MSEVWIGRGAMLFSAGLHVFLLSAPPRAARAEVPRPQASFVEFTVPPPAPVKLPEPEPVQEEAKPEPAVEPKPLRVKPASVEAPPQHVDASVPDVAPEEVAAPESAAHELPAELTGQTLVSDLGADWSAPVGSGAARRGVFRPGVSRVVHRSVTRKRVEKAPAHPLGPPVVPLAQLARKPIPPALGASLKRNYPQAARRQGKSGEAKVRARIEANGNVVIALIREQSSAEFGLACQKTLKESRWSAPVDAKGRKVATWISYRCKFRIDD